MAGASRSWDRGYCEEEEACALSVGACLLAPRPPPPPSRRVLSVPLNPSAGK